MVAIKRGKMINFKNRMTNECVWDKQVSANDLWKEMIKRVLKIAKEFLGESKSYIRCRKETWW